MAFSKLYTAITGVITEAVRHHKIFPAEVAPAFLARKAYDWSMQRASMFMGTSPSPMEAVDPLTELRSKLDELNTSTEGEFLSIGESLLGFREQAGEISGMASSVAHQMSGEATAGAMRGLRSILVRMEQIKGESEQNTETLKQVLEALCRLQGHLDGFSKIIRMLSALCNSTRIENARLGDRDIGFGALTDDVRKLVSMIEIKSEELLDRSRSLSEVIQRTLAHVTGIEAKQHGQVKVVFDGTMSSLESLTEKHRMSSSAATNISQRYDAVSKSMGEIVASMQFHDITRQRIEHVGQALESAGKQTGKTDEKGRGGNGRRGLTGNGSPAASIAPDVCVLQMAQLEFARRELSSAVSSIVENLRVIAVHVDKMSTEARKMAGVAGEDDHSSFIHIEEGVSAATSALSGYGDSSREMELAMSSAGATLGDMSIFAKDIEGIGTRIKLIALNAIVKASHIGEDGAALSVLAENTHHLSVETCLLTHEVCEDLKSIIVSADLLSAGVSTDRGPRNEEISRMKGELDGLLASFREANGNIVSLLSHMDDEGQKLSSDIGRTVSEIRVHEKVDGVITGVVSELQRMVDSSAALKNERGPAHANTTLREIESSYTMLGERAIHQSVIESGMMPDASRLADDLSRLAHPFEISKSDEGSDGESQEDDLGDNVELF
jgi:methyl-accepting chemotaxis protein